MPSDLAYHERHFARFYDWQFGTRTEDLPLYLGLAKRYGGPVLELACGTGRLLLPLARAGFEVIGLDLSAEMLRILRRKLRHEPPEARRRVRLLHGDMADFHLDRPARLAFVPFSSFFHLHTRAQRLACLRCAFRALAPGGAFLVDVQTPWKMEDQTETAQPEELRACVNPQTGLMTRELHQRLVQDARARHTTVQHTYVEDVPGGRARRYTFAQDYTWVTPEDMVPLFLPAGFRHVKVCGGYGLRPFRPRSSRLIFLAGK